MEQQWAWAEASRWRMYRKRYRLGRTCSTDPNALLFRDGVSVSIAPKALDVLHYLATRPARLVTKEELLAAIWPDVIVSDASIKVCVRRNPHRASGRPEDACALWKRCIVGGIGSSASRRRRR